MKLCLAIVLLVLGCAPAAPEAVCEALLDCLAEADPLEVGPATAHFGPSGACWSEPDAAARCASACEAARRELVARAPDAAACHPDPHAPLSDRVGPGRWGWSLRAIGDCDPTHRFRGAYDGTLLADDDTFRLELEAPEAPAWHCAVSENAFACTSEGAAAAPLTLDGRFHPSYTRLDATLHAPGCAWTLHGWRLAAHGDW